MRTLDPTSAEVREQLSIDSYERHVRELYATLREHDLGPQERYYYVPWDEMPDPAKQPYRVAVAECMDALAAALEAE